MIAAITSDEWRAKALRVVLSSLSPLHIAQVRQFIAVFDQAAVRAGLLLDVLAIAPAPLALSLVDDILADLAMVEDAHAQSVILHTLLAYAPEAALPPLQQIIRRLRNDRLRAELQVRLVQMFPNQLAAPYLLSASSLGEQQFVDRLITVAPLLPAATLTQAADVARGLTDLRLRAEALLVVAQQCHGVQSDALWADVRVLAHRVLDAPWQAEVLAFCAQRATPDSGDVVGEVLDILRAIPQDDARLAALIDVAPMIPESSQDAILALASDFAAAKDRVVAHSSLLSIAPARLRPRIAQVVLDRDVAQLPIDARIQVIEQVAPALDAGGGALALRVIAGLETDADIARGIIAFAPVLAPSPCLTPLRVCAQSIHEHDWQVEALIELARYAPSDQAVDLIHQIVHLLPALPQEAARANALLQLGTYLPTPLIPLFLDQLMRLHDNQLRVKILGTSVPHILDAGVAPLVACARAIREGRMRAEALALIAPYAPPAQQRELVAEALRAAHTILDIRERSEALHALTHLVPLAQQATLAVDVLTTARSITDLRWRAQIVTDLAAQVPDAIFAEVLAFLEDLPSATLRGEMIQRMIPQLPPDRAIRLSDLVDRIADAAGRAETLAVLALHVVPNQRNPLWTQVVQMAMALPEGALRVELLTLAGKNSHGDEQDRLHLEALETLAAIVGEEERTELIETVAAYLSSRVCWRLSPLLRLITNTTLYARAAVAVAPYLTPEDRDEVIVTLRRPELRATGRSHIPLAERDNVVRELRRTEAHPTSHRSRPRTGDEAHNSPRSMRISALSLEAMVRCKALRDAVPLPELLADIHLVASEMDQAELMVDLLPHLTEPQRATLLKDIFPLVCQVPDLARRVKLLATMLALSQGAQQHAIMEEALVAGQALANPATRATALANLIPYASPSLEDEILTAVSEIVTYIESARVIQEITPMLSMNRRLEVVTQALMAACAIEDHQMRRKVLAALAPALSACANSPNYRLEATRLYHQSIHVLASHDRPGFLASIAALTPWLKSFAPNDEAAHLVQAILDVCRCWP
ncbi:MAG: hypothetical protein WCF99_00285 [Chloroflexales bacterium]